MSMWWRSPVRVMVGASTAYNVTSNTLAAELLLGEAWPGKGSARHLRAREAVLRSMERPADAVATIAAQKAFEAAAREAGILME